MRDINSPVKTSFKQKSKSKYKKKYLLDNNNRIQAEISLAGKAD